MENLQGFDFQPIEINSDGSVQSGAEELAQGVKTSGATDVIFICHGFRNDENDARGLYGRFLESFGEQKAQASIAAKLTRKYAVGGVFWPSMIFPETADNQGGAQSIGATATSDANARLQALKFGQTAENQEQLEAMIAIVSSGAEDEGSQLKLAQALLRLSGGLALHDDNEFGKAFANATPTALRAALQAGDALVVTPVGGGGGGAAGIPGMTAMPARSTGGAQSFFGNIVGFVPKFLNLTTFLLMFHRCGDVGEKGMCQAVRRVKELSPNVRVHLVGHSLGGRSVTACAKGLLAPSAVKVDSMMMLEAAYSHFGLSAGSVPGGVDHPRGFYRDVIEQKVVKGPILATHSEHDSVVGFAYTSMAAVSLNNARVFGDEHSAFGGIGRNGVLDTAEAVSQELNVPGVAYAFANEKIHNLDGSRSVDGKALISSHGDVTNSAIAWAFASLVAGT